MSMYAFQSLKLNGSNLDLISMLNIFVLFEHRTPLKLNQTPKQKTHLPVFKNSWILIPIGSLLDQDSHLEIIFM